MFGRKRYEDEGDLVDENAIGGTFIPPQKLDWLDYVIAAVLGVFAMVLSYVLSYRGLHLDAWSECVVAAGVRTPESMLPGFWNPCAKLLLSVLGVSRGLVVLTILGKVFLGGLVALGYLIFKQTLAILVRMVETNRLWAGILSRCVCAVSAVLFLCADPVWSLGAYFSPALLQAFLFSLTVFLLASFLANGSVRPAYGAMFLLGLLGAETPLGLFSLAVFWLLFYVMLRKGSLFHVKLLEPLMQQHSKWYLTFFWAVGLLLGIAINISSFKVMGGMELTGLSVSSIPLHYASLLWRAFWTSAHAGAWIVGVGGTTMAFVLGVAMLRRATDLEYFLHYHVGIVFFVIGCLAYSQLSSIHPLWFWTFGDVFVVKSKLLLFLCALMCAGSVLTALAVTVIDAFCRDHRRLAAQFDPDLEESLQAKGTHKRYLLPIIGVSVACGLLLAGSIPGRVQRDTNEALALIDDYVREIVTEVGDRRFLFSDGQYDCGIELESARRGGSLKCIPAQPAENGRRGQALVSLMEDDEDRLSARVDGANVLSSWQKHKRDRLNQCALQVGLEYWRQRAVNDTYPSVSGVVAKPEWPDEAAVNQGIYRTLGLAERVLRMYQATGELPKKASQSVRDMFLFMQWRLARMARVRSEIFGFKRRLVEANEESKLAEALDEKNASLKRILQNMAAMREHTMRQMTPREGLRSALLRADFPLAHRYADSILDSDPHDADANFGIGMDYLLQEQFNLAEPRLLACLERRPMEPAIWNNLAVLQYRQGRFDEALANAQKALSLAPRSKEVMDTIVKIKKGKDPDYQPEADEALKLNAEDEILRAKGQIQKLKSLLDPAYKPARDLDLANASVKDLVDLMPQLVRLVTGANNAVLTAQEAEENKRMLEAVQKKQEEEAKAKE